MTESAGIRHLAQILLLVARHPGIRLREICARGGLARTGTSEILAKLETAGFLYRTTGGKCHLGPKAFALGLAPLGLAGIADKAEPVLLWLRQETGAVATLRAADTGDILEIPPQHHRPRFRIEAPVGGRAEAGACKLSLGWPQEPDADVIAYANECLESACQALSRGLPRHEAET